MNRLREVLGDSADNPHLIETLPRRGYRFIGTIAKPPSSPGVSCESGEITAESPASVQVKDETRGRLSWLKVGAGILAGATCALAVLSLYIKFRTHAEPATLTAVPFTVYPGLEVCPTFSPDGSHIAFAWNGDPEAGSKGFDLYVKVIGSESLLRLTHHPSDFICPAWSPDGTQIAFHRVSRADAGVYVVPALGGPERRLRGAKPYDIEAEVSRSPDGKWTDVPFEISAPLSWSPDGEWIAYVESRFYR